MSQANKGIARRLLEAMNTGDLDVIDEIVDPGYRTHDPSLPPDHPTGPEGVKQLIQLYRGAFPDVRMTIEDQIAEGDLVVTRWTATGTHRGDLQGIAPTGRQARISGIAIDRIAGGKITENWENWDTLGLLQQVGAIPEPAPAEAS
jgi:steroid delta-isomerase-like uncharacterized protein